MAMQVSLIAGQSVAMTALTARMPVDVAALFPESAEVYHEAEHPSVDAMVAASRTPSGGWNPGVLRLSTSMAQLGEDETEQILLHELAHLLTLGRGGDQHSQTPSVATDQGHDQYWIGIYAALTARCGKDLTEMIGPELYYLKQFGIHEADVDAASARALGVDGMNRRHFERMVNRIGDEREVQARKSWRASMTPWYLALAGAAAAAVGFTFFTITHI